MKKTYIYCSLLFFIILGCKNKPPFGPEEITKLRSPLKIVFNVKKTVDLPDKITGMVIHGAYLCITLGNSGLSIVDISEPNNSHIIGSYSIPGSAEGIAVSGAYAYIPEWRSGLRVVDISQPSTPTEVGFCGVEGELLGIALSGSYAYISGGDTIKVIDITIPSVPKVVNYHAIGNSIDKDITISGNYLYVIEPYGDFWIIDISNPLSLETKSFYDTYCYLTGIAVSGSYAYISDGNLGLLVADISNPASPHFLNLIPWYDYYYSQSYYTVEVSGSYAYAVGKALDADWNSEQELRVVDISKPDSLVEIGLCNTPCNNLTNVVVVAGSYAYVADYKKLQVIETGLQ